MGMTMDMQPYFQMVQEGIPYETVLENAADTAVGRYEGRPDISLEEIGTYAAVRDHLTVQLVGKEKNEEMLRQIPHHDLEDMSVIYRLQIRSDGYGEASITVTNTMLEQYGVTAEQLHRDAVESAAVRPLRNQNNVRNTQRIQRWNDYSGRRTAPVCCHERKPSQWCWSPVVSRIHGSRRRPAEWQLLYSPFIRS